MPRIETLKKDPMDVEQGKEAGRGYSLKLMEQMPSAQSRFHGWRKVTVLCTLL